MKLLEQFHEKLCGSVLFPLSNSLYNRRNVIDRYHRYSKSQFFLQEKLQQIQLIKLREIITYAYAHILFYRDFFKKLDLHPQDVKSLRDIKLIPPLSRQEVIDYHKDMVDHRLHESISFAEKSTRGPGEPIPFARFKKHRLVKNTSSGSTGAPTIFYEDGAITASNWTNELRLRQWFGVNPGAREARFARISTDYMPNNRSVLMRKALWNQLLLPGVNLSEPDYELCYQKLNLFQPQVMWGFTSSLAGLAGYLKQRKMNLHWTPKVCITWAAPLYDHEKDIIERIFNCPVTNIYGAREVGHIAALCPENSLHINQETLLVETIKDNDGWSGIENGEIVVTTLEPTPMPFIRYRMGDIGEVTESHCSCGRTLSVLDNFQGRTGEIFITRDGKMISPNFWCRTFMNKQLAGAINRFQVIYTKEGNINLKIVKHDNFTSDTEKALRNFLSENFHADVQIRFHYVDAIRPQVSGKYQMVVKE